MAEISYPHQTHTVLENSNNNDSISESYIANMKLPAGLDESRTELVNRVQNLKHDLKDWRGKLDTQMESYKEEIGDLRESLNTEVEQLKSEFQELRNTLKEQLQVTTSKLAELDATVADSASFFEGLSVQCELGRSMVDNLRADFPFEEDNFKALSSATSLAPPKSKK